MAVVGNCVDDALLGISIASKRGGSLDGWVGRVACLLMLVWGDAGLGVTR